ncbi:DUF6477 family protein [Parasedimentitalea psychrophila]|uniref:DUF6477 family protein n=1 Tax=Parasedimentitalea psychrophila TaxID=2997337 RepID=A0A9Y2KXD8_9RHOB|nr:DUF6477 family protein [Parasedimentitalea psychrophila]WIY24890.1 DUF6477 family protein [Parasedimentitalea psychrophila]
MLDLIARLSSLHRPRLLIRAARIGARDYSRTRHLPRLLGYGGLPRPASAVMQLIEQEQHLNQRRLDNEPGYPLTRHVEVLIAMMGESQLLSDNQQQRPKNAAATDTGSRPVSFQKAGC